VLAAQPPGAAGLRGTQLLAPPTVPGEAPAGRAALAGPGGAGAGALGPGSGGPVPAVLGAAGGPPLRANVGPPTGRTGPPAGFPPPTAPAPAGPYRRSPRWPIWVAVAVVLLAAAALTTALVIRDVGSNGAPAGGQPSSVAPSAGRPTSSAAATSSPPVSTATAGTPPATTASAIPTVALDPADFVGRDVGKVVKELHDLGLRTQVQEAPAGTPGDPGKVVGIEPAGPVPTGSTITVVAIPRKSARQ